MKILNKTKKIILIIVIILIATIMLMNNRVKATVGITSAISGALEEAIETENNKIINDAVTGYKSGLTKSQLEEVIEKLQLTVDNAEKMNPRPGYYEPKKRLLNNYKKDLESTPITKTEAEKLSKDELNSAINKLTTKRTQQGGSLTATERKDLEIYENLYNEKYTQPELEEKDQEDQKKDLEEGADPITNPDAYKPNSTGGNTAFIGKANIIIGTIRVVGTVIAVVALMVIGLRYMFGSIEERANYKETMVPYLIGAVMILTIPNLLGIIYNLVSSIKF